VHCNPPLLAGQQMSAKDRQAAQKPEGIVRYGLPIQARVALRVLEEQVSPLLSAMADVEKECLS